MAGFKNECWKWLVVGLVCASACGGPTQAVEDDGDGGVEDAGGIQMDATGSWSGSSSGSSSGGVSGSSGSSAAFSGCSLPSGDIASGAVNPSDACQFCDPVSHSNSWSDFPDGTACGGGEFCRSGTCSSGCFIGGSLYQPGAADPRDACQTCNPAADGGSWSKSPDGMSCGSGQVCHSGSCMSGCFIGGAVYQPGHDLRNDCQSCDPGVSTNAWTPEANDTGCSSNGGNYCQAGSCVAGCLVGGNFEPSGQRASANDCQVCAPATSSTSFSAEPDGTACNQGGTYCARGYCRDLCDIQGALFGNGVMENQNPNACCNTAYSSTAWTPAFEIVDGGPAIQSLPSNATLADITNDGILDLIVGEGSGFEVLVGTGTGTFSPLSSISITATQSVQVADVNGDGSPDVVILTSNSATQVANIMVMLNSGQPDSLAFSTQSTYVVPYPATSFVIGNFAYAGSRDVTVHRDASPHAARALRS